MESPSLTKSEHQIDVTTDHDSSSNVEHSVGTAAEDAWPPTTRQPQRGPLKFRLCDPFSEFVVTLVLIFTAILVLILTKHEQQQKKSLYPWIIGYTYLSISTLPILYWRFRQYSSATGIIEEIRKLKIVAEYALVGWVVSLVWHFIDNSSSLDDTTSSYFWLCLAFVAFSFTLHVLPNLDGAVVCFFIPMVARLIPLGIHACLLYFQLNDDIMWYIGAVCLLFIGIPLVCVCACAWAWQCLACICMCCCCCRE